MVTIGTNFVLSTVMVSLLVGDKLEVIVCNVVDVDGLKVVVQAFGNILDSVIGLVTLMDSPSWMEKFLVQSMFFKGL